MNLYNFKQQWVDNEAHHKHIHELFSQHVTNDPILDVHRTYIEQRVFGMGERSFWWLWKMILEELPEQPKLLEIGIFKGATISLWKLLREDAQVFGITPLDGRGTGWTEDDYWLHIQNIHNDFELEQPKLFIGGSEEAEMISAAYNESPYNVLYIDGNHSEEGALGDLINYAPMVKKDGWLVVDDSACRTSQPFGYFQGIQSVCDALEKWEQTEIAKEFEFQFNVVHLMVYKRI